MGFHLYLHQVQYFIYHSAPFVLLTLEGQICHSYGRKWNEQAAFSLYKFNKNLCNTFAMDQARRQGIVYLYYARVNGGVKAGEDRVVSNLLTSCQSL